MGLPNIQIQFTETSRTILPRSERGIVLVIAETSSTTEPLRYEFTKVPETTTLSAKSAKGLAYAKTALFAGAKKVIVHLVNGDHTLSDVLTAEKSTKYNYLVFPEAETSEKAAIVTYINDERTAGKARKAVLFDAGTPNSSGVINFTTVKVNVDKGAFGGAFSSIGTDKTTYYEVGGADYTARIAGTLAGLSLAMSSTYYALSDLLDCEASTDPDADIDAGKLILVNDSEKVKIGRGVNSNTSGAESFKKIKLVDGMDLILEDIKKIFNDEFVGKVTASYENKLIFINAINKIYFKGLLSSVLDPNYDNSVGLDLEAIKEFIEAKGDNPDNYTDAELKAYPTGTTLFLTGKIRLLDALEDLTLNINL